MKMLGSSNLYLVRLIYVQSIPSRYKNLDKDLDLASAMSRGENPSNKEDSARTAMLRLRITLMDECEICGAVQGLDRHHVIPRRMGGTKDEAVHDEDNLITLCRSCHRNLHDARWRLDRTDDGIRVTEPTGGEEIMRRHSGQGVDAPSLFQLLNLAEDSLSRLHAMLHTLTDEQLVEAFAYASSFGKRSWLIQAAILFEAQKRSTYGERTLEAIARRFEIGLRQAQKYALVWRLSSPRRANKIASILTQSC